jgi:hypothetical protein
MTLPITITGKCKIDGYRTGYFWDVKVCPWIPGGPWAHDPESQQQRRDWQNAWERGLNDRRFKRPLIAELVFRRKSA